MYKTNIEWCDSTWNPVTGCLHGCEYCYARKIANRFGGIDEIIESAAQEGIELDDAYFRNPEYFCELDEPVRNSKGKAEPYPTNFYPALHRYRLDIPQKWKDPRTIFVCSMADLFGDWVPNSWIEEVFEACRKAPQHRYLFLTKNVKRYAEYGVPTSGNMWYGISITKESQMSDFNSLPALANTFISFEPLLEDLNVNDHNVMFKHVNWFIIGAETGNKSGKVIPKKEWVDGIVKLADEHGKPVFMKESLLPIMGEENMRREFPWGNGGGKNESKQL